MKIIEVSAKLRVSNQTIKRYIHSGKLKATMTPKPKGEGGHAYYWITDKDLEEYLKHYESNTKKSSLS